MFEDCLMPSAITFDYETKRAGNADQDFDFFYDLRLGQAVLDLKILGSSGFRRESSCDKTWSSKERDCDRTGQEGSGFHDPFSIGYRQR
jgi:hypothetical protein